MNDIKSTSPVKVVRTDFRSKYSADLDSYTFACRKDSSIKSFDYLHHQRTSRVITSLAAQANTQSLNVDSLVELHKFLLELNQDAVRFIIECREDVRKNKHLSSLVDVYFKSTSEILDFCNTVKNCVKKIKISQLLIRFMLKKFEIESVYPNVEGSKKKKYAKTVEELNKFKAMGDPFDGKLVTQYNSVYKQQILLLGELCKMKAKLKKKQRKVKTFMILLNVFFVNVYVSVFVLSVVAAAMIALSVIASGLTAPIEIAGI